MIDCRCLFAFAQLQIMNLFTGLNPMIIRIFRSSVLVLLLFVSSSVAGTGGITGKATLSGTRPAEAPIKFDADPKCKTMHSAGVTTRHYVVDGSGNLANVFVYVKEGLGGKKFPAPSSAVILDQQACLYQPYVLGVQTGQTLTIQNSDDTSHNVHALGKNNPEFNVGQPVKGVKMDKQFSKPEVFVKLKCDIHPWMYAYVGVVEHPFFAVTGTDGSFKIAGIPDGDYTIAAMHPKTGEKTAKVKIAGGEVKTDFIFEPKAQ